MLKRVPFRSGINKTDTEYSQEGTWIDGDHVRFKNGRAEKIGGFTTISSTTLDGTPRGMFSWRSNASIKFLAIHTNLRHYVWTGGAAYNITPIRSSGTLGANPFATTDGSTTVTVTHTSHGSNIRNQCKHLCHNRLFCCNEYSCRWWWIVSDF